MRHFSLCLIGFVCLLLASCGPNLKDQILGKWKGKDRGTTIVGDLDFTKDGKVTKEAMGKSMPGTYKWIDSDHVEMELTMPTGTKIKEKNKVVITKDSLTLTNEQGKTDEFTRAP